VHARAHENPTYSALRSENAARGEPSTAFANVFEVLQKRELMSLHEVVGDIGFTCRSLVSAVRNKPASQRSGSTLVPFAVPAVADAKAMHGSAKVETAVKDAVASSSARLRPDTNASAHANSNALAVGFLRIFNMLRISSSVVRPGAALMTWSRCAALAAADTAAGSWLGLELFLPRALGRCAAQVDMPAAE
jgi:hypothetical protein